MKHNKGSSIILYKENKTQADSRDIIASRSKLKQQFNSSPEKANRFNRLNQHHDTQRIKPSDYSLRNKPHLKACNMEDNQIRIKRQYSPLYQTSTRQTQMFQKGLKKSASNINLQSKIIFNQSSEIKQQRANNISVTNIKRKNPNQQNLNIFDSGNNPTNFPLTSRSIKKDPNIESSFKQPRKQKSLIKDKNNQTSNTADYVVKALSNHASYMPRQIHLKFTKKQNTLNKQNLNSEANHGSDENKKHKRHFSNLTKTKNKQNIEFKQNGVCCKQSFEENTKHARKQFNHEFFKHQSRMGDHQKQAKLHKNSQKYKFSCKENVKTSNYLKTQYQQKIHAVSRVAQLRKRFL